VVVAFDNPPGGMAAREADFNIEPGDVIRVYELGADLCPGTVTAPDDVLLVGYPFADERYRVSVAESETGPLFVVGTAAKSDETATVGQGGCYRRIREQQAIQLTGCLRDGTYSAKPPPGTLIRTNQRPGENPCDEIDRETTCYEEVGWRRRWPWPSR
jgi:hypothetical protein